MKVLISEGFGAGWSTWHKGEVGKYMRTYEPIITALENGEEITEEHPAVIQLQKDCKEKFNEELYLGGLDGLCVQEAVPPFMIHEYDGAESLIFPGDSNDWIMSE